MTNNNSLNNSKKADLSELIEKWSHFQKNKLIDKMKNEFDENTQNQFALFLIGSLARDEASYSYDRDSYLVFSNCVTEDSKRNIIKKISEIFNQLDIPRCPDLMSFENSDWNGTVTQWNARLEMWSKKLSPKNSIKLSALSSSSLIFGNSTLYNPKKVLIGLYPSAQRIYFILYFINLINICISVNPKRTRRVLTDISEFTFLYNKNLITDKRYIIDTKTLVHEKVLSSTERKFLIESYFNSISLTFPLSTEIGKLGTKVTIFKNAILFFKIKHIALKVYTKYLGELLRG